MQDVLETIHASVASLRAPGDALAPMAQKKPNDVFTPRNPEINEAMYIARPNLERAVLRGLEGTKHLLIHGESGSGKSWLYKRTLHQAGAAMLVANLANASRLGSIVNEIKTVVAELEQPIRTGFTEAKAAEANAFGFIKGNLAHTDTYQTPQQEPLERCFQLLRERAADKVCCLVLDNLETVFNSDGLMSELGEIIVLLDDARYAKHGVKLLIVGVPSGVREYFSRVANRSTVTNRLHELPEVASLDASQVNALVRTGFTVELGYDCDEETMLKIVERVNYFTSGIPQRVHEFCLEIAYLAQDGEKLEESSVEPAAKEWLRSSLTSAYSAVESMMNERNTVAGRRNQVLFALGLIEKDEFRYTEIEDIVRNEFHNSTQGKTLNVSALLTDLSARQDSLIKRSPKGDNYVFVDPKYRMCLRAMLKKSGDRVDKLDIRQVLA